MTSKRERVQWVFTRLAVAGLCLASASWLLSFYVLEPRVEVVSLAGVDRVEISVAEAGPGRGLRSITEPARVAALVVFADGVRHGWRSSWHTMPGPTLRACYFTGEQLRYCIGAGPDFLAMWGSEARGLQSATPDHTRRFAALVGVSDTLVNRW